jgi:hypothetical protein
MRWDFKSIANAENKNNSTTAFGHIPVDLFLHHTWALGNIRASPLDIMHKCAPMQNNPKLLEKIEEEKISFNS